VLGVASDRSERPLFVAGHGFARTVGMAVVSAICVAFGGFWVWADVNTPGGSAIEIGLGALFILIGVLPSWVFFRTRKITFYEDHFEVTNAGSFNNSFSYFDVESVRCFSYSRTGAVFPSSLGPSPRILLNMYQDHKQTQLAIDLNPYNKELGMHLCDWLLRKSTGKAAQLPELGNKSSEEAQ